LRELLHHDDAVLVKGSRAVGLESVAQALARGDVAGGARGTDGPQTAGAGPVIALLVALGVAFMLSILGTPLLIRILVRQRYRPADS
jgi:hypothetical protein